MDIGECETAAQLYLHASRFKPVSTLGIPLVDAALLQSPRVIEITGDEGTKIHSSLPFTESAQGQVKRSLLCVQ